MPDELPPKPQQPALPEPPEQAELPLDAPPLAADEVPAGNEIPHAMRALFPPAPTPQAKAAQQLGRIGVFPFRPEDVENRPEQPQDRLPPDAPWRGQTEPLVEEPEGPSPEDLVQARAQARGWERRERLGRRQRPGRFEIGPEDAAAAEDEGGPGGAAPGVGGQPAAPAGGGFEAMTRLLEEMKTILGRIEGHTKDAAEALKA